MLRGDGRRNDTEELVVTRNIKNETEDLVDGDATYIPEMITNVRPVSPKPPYVCRSRGLLSFVKPESLVSSPLKRSHDDIDVIIS